MLELRYRGLRSPHKIKLGVSGLRARVRGGPRQGRRRHRDRQGLERLRRRQRRLHAAARAAARRGPRHRDAGPHHRPVPPLLRAHGRPAAAHGAVDRGRRGRPRRRPRGRHGGLAGHRGRPRRADGAARRRVRGRVARHARGPGEAAPVRVLRQRARRRPTRRSRTSPERGQSRPATADERDDAARRRTTNPSWSPEPDWRCAHDRAGDASSWSRRCCRSRPTSRRSAAPRRCSDGDQVALFRLVDGRVLAVQQHDPFSDAYVISRGIVGSRSVDDVEVPTVASPMYKQVFDLDDGPVPGRRRQGARPGPGRRPAHLAGPGARRARGGGLVTTMLGLELTGRRVLVVGGGPVAARRVQSLLADAARVVVVAPQLCEVLARPAPLGPDRVARPRGGGVRPRRCLARAHRHGRPRDGRRRARVGHGAPDVLRRRRLAAPTARPARPRPPSRATSWWASSRRARRTRGARIAVRDAVAAQLREGRVDLRHRRAHAGRVVLVGGGPGDVGLLTLAGRRALAEADVVVTDRLGSGRRARRAGARRRGHRRRQDARPPPGAAARDRPDPRRAGAAGPRRRPAQGRRPVRVRPRRRGGARLPGGRRARRGDPRGEQRVRRAGRRRHPADAPRHGRCRARDERARRLVVGRPHGPAGRRRAPSSSSWG